MNNVSFNGFNAQVATFNTECDTTMVGRPVTFGSDDLVVPAGNGNVFFGVCISTRANLAGVQLEGYVELRYTGTAPERGYCGLVADANNGVKVAEQTTANTHLVLKVDKDKSTVGFIL